MKAALGRPSRTKLRQVRRGGWALALLGVLGYLMWPAHEPPPVIRALSWSEVSGSLQALPPIPHPELQAEVDRAEAQQKTQPRARNAVTPGDAAWLLERLKPLRYQFAAVLRSPAEYRLQILVSRVLDDGEGGKRLVQHGYRVDHEYFYPASAIKTFVSVAALRRLAELRVESGKDIDLDTPLAYCTVDETECVDGRDPTNLRGGTITVGHEIRKMQLVSSNVAFNRLYNFVGHRELNTTLHAMGFDSVRLRHRFRGGEPGGRSTPRIDVFLPGGDSWIIARRTSDLTLAPTLVPGVQIGRAHYDPDHGLVEHPADFSNKNYASVRDLHALMIALVMPELPGANGLGLSPKERDFLLTAMGENPLRSANPPFAGTRWTGARYKVLMRGMRQVLPLQLLRYLNKGGRAYGFEIDNAYIENRHNGRALFVTAVIYANPNQVVGDDGYAYSGVTGPFLEALGASLAYAALR